jgi:hypothetical protein
MINFIITINFLKSRVPSTKAMDDIERERRNKKERERKRKSREDKTLFRFKGSAGTRTQHSRYQIVPKSLKIFFGNLEFFRKHF